MGSYLVTDVLDYLNLEDGTNRLFQNVGNYQSTLRNIPEEWVSQELHFFWHTTCRFTTVYLHVKYFCDKKSTSYTVCSSTVTEYSNSLL